MATANIIERSIALKYADKGTFSFQKFDFEATDEQLYTIGEAINGLQADPMVKLVKVTTKAIY